MTEQVDQNQRRLKRIVIFLGILLVICFCIVIGTIAYRLSKMGNEEVEAKADPLPIIEAAPSDNVLPDIAVTLPKGARILSITEAGTDYLVLMDTPSGQLVWLVDSDDGAVRQAIRFLPSQ